MEIKFTKDITQNGSSKGIIITREMIKQAKLNGEIPKDFEFEVGEVVEVIIIKKVKNEDR